VAVDSYCKNKQAYFLSHPVDDVSGVGRTIKRFIGGFKITESSF